MTQRSRDRKGKPVLAMGLVVIGGIIALLGVFLLPDLGFALTTLNTYVGGVGEQVALSIISAVVVFISGFALYTRHMTRAHIWSVVALIFSIIGLATSGSFVLPLVGFAIALVGSILGITYNGEETS
ncbi:MAG: hypothetical protein M1528_02065 [Candidatus Marsarchaeota archaeon]|nr:hypothetical protein [Candidatus Marsarchaeota archaeon]MCL5115294.1 hypothetical protein [Candidatus Marsarchaeota archaeon]